MAVASQSPCAGSGSGLSNKSRQDQEGPWWTSRRDSHACLGYTPSLYEDFWNPWWKSYGGSHYCLGYVPY